MNTTLTLNIGLARDGQSNIGVGTALRELNSLGFAILAYAGHTSDTEQTLVVQVLHLGDFRDVGNHVYHLSVLLGQDCIAVIDNDDNEGTLIGPRADKWAPFNPAYFLNLDGTRLGN
jgi:hypothetical protein